MYKVKKITVIIIAIFVCLIAYLCIRERIKAVDIPFDLYSEYQGKDTIFRTPDGNFIYQTKDKRRTSSIFYHTVGIHLSRIKSDVNPFEEPYHSDDVSLSSSDPHYYYASGSTNPKEAKRGMSRESFLLDFDNLQKVEYNRRDGYQINTYVIPDDMIMNGISSKWPEWYAEIQTKLENKEPVYLGVDHITQICHESNGVITYKSGSIDPSGTLKGSLYTWANWRSILNAESWNIEASISTHYNRYLNYNGDAEGIHMHEFPELTADEKIQKDGGKFDLTKNSVTNSTGPKSITTAESKDRCSAPDIRTWNTDDAVPEEFKIGEAIPASEGYINYIENDAWYGHVEMQRYLYTLTQRFNWKITYRYNVKHKGLRPSATGTTVIGGIPMEEYEWVTEVSDAVSSDDDGYDPVKAKLTRKFYAIEDVNLLQLIETTTHNDAADRDPDYNVPGQDTSHVTYDVTINQTNVKSGSSMSREGDQYFASPDWEMEPNAHLDKHLNEIDKSLIVKDAGNIGDSNNKAAAYNAQKDAVQQEADNRMKPEHIVVASNDEMTLNGTPWLTKYGINALLEAAWASGTHEIGAEPSGDQKDKIKDQCSLTIPESKENGRYWTMIHAFYEKLISSKDVVDFKIDDNETKTDKAIKQGYEQNEPIIVFSPVISPLTINGSDATQLVNEAYNGGQRLTQLLLDHQYRATFDWHTYFSFLGYSEDQIEGLTQYVQKKEVQFPFAVRVNGVYHEVKSDGYTEPIRVFSEGEDRTYFDFYVPCWSKEGVYGLNGYSGYDAKEKPIRVRVYANNYNETFASRITLEHNDYLDMYVAEFNYPVQVSGIIYGFQVVATNDPMSFGDANYVDENMNVFNFVKQTIPSSRTVAEKKNGTHNRVGGNAVRYTIDGMVTNAWNYRNTLPFASGKSNYYNDNGFLQRGSTIGFTIKTIANLSGDSSYINLKPRFRYIGRDGSVKESNQIKIYYSYGGDDYIEMGSAKDKSLINKVSLNGMPGALYFNGSYFDYRNDTFAETAAIENTTKQYIMTKEADCYCMDLIHLNKDLRLITSNEEELDFTKVGTVTSIDESNLQKNSADALRYNFNTISSTSKGESKSAYRTSMQTWYGMYHIPDSIKVAPVGVDLSSYDYLDGTEDFWLDDGYLVLNFDIETYRDGDNEHLTYYGSSLNMWGQEKTGSNTPNPAYPKERVNDGISDGPEITMRNGDIGIISLSNSIMDWYEAGALYLN